MSSFENVFINKRTDAAHAHNIRHEVFKVVTKQRRVVVKEETFVPALHCPVSSLFIISGKI